MTITPEFIFVLKVFGSIIVFLLTVITGLGGVIWRDLRKEIRMIKSESEKSLKEFKEDERNRCAMCAAHNKYEHEALKEELNTMWAAVDECCPRAQR